MSFDIVLQHLLTLITYCLLSSGFLSQTTLAQNEVSSTPERRYACWGSFGPPVVSAQCPRDTVIQVIRAGLKVQSHGGRCSYSEQDCGCEYGELGCNMPNVRDLCMGRPACRLDVTQQYINTDKCRGFSDYMFIDFNCVTVQQNTVYDICTNKVDVSETGFVKSPNYPHSSAYKQTCQCSLIAEGTGSVELAILDLNTKDCKHNKLQVSSGSGDSNTYCGSSPQNGASPRSGQVSLIFEADGLGMDGGFWLKYEAVPKGPVKIQCHVQMREQITTTTSTTAEPSTTPKPTIDQARYQAMLEAREKARQARQKAAREKAAREQAAEQAAREQAAKEEREKAEREKEEELKRQLLTRDNHDGGSLEVNNEKVKLQDAAQNTPWWWKFTMKSKSTRMTVPTKEPEKEEVVTVATRHETPDRRNLRPQHRATDPEHSHPVTNDPGKSLHPLPMQTPNIPAPTQISNIPIHNANPSSALFNIPDKPANTIPKVTRLVQQQDARKAQSNESDEGDDIDKKSRKKPAIKKRRRQNYRKVKRVGSVNQANPGLNNVLYKKFLTNRISSTVDPTTESREDLRQKVIAAKRNYNGKDDTVDADMSVRHRVHGDMPDNNINPEGKADNVNYHNSDKDHERLNKFKNKYDRYFPSSTQTMLTRPILVRVTPTLLAVPVSSTRASTPGLHPRVHPTPHNHATNVSNKASTQVTTTHNMSPTDKAYSHSRNGGRPASSNYASNTGLHGNELHKDTESKPKEESMTVTIIAACVIGSILLIIIIGIVVRFVINRQDPHYAMRQHHKKECVMRHNAKAQRKGF